VLVQRPASRFESGRRLGLGAANEVEDVLTLEVARGTHAPVGEERIGLVGRSGVFEDLAELRL
jgi:hypothetical protein